MTKHFPASLMVVAMLIAGSFANDWSNWRGPNYNGTADATNLPTNFSQDKGVKWSLQMPGPSAATPIIVGDRVFVSSTDVAREQLVAMCVDRNNGKVLWKHDVHSGYNAGRGDRLRFDSRSTYASPSPVCDGKTVVFFYGNGDLIAFTVEGKKLWSTNLQTDFGPFTFQWTFSASPTLYDGSLFLQILRRDEPVHGIGTADLPSYVVAMNPTTGKVLWKHERPSPAQKESLESFATPIPYEANGRKEILIVGGDVLTGHDPKTGKELWRWGTWNPEHREAWWRLVPSVVVGDGVALVCAPKKAPVYAVNLEGKKQLAWKSETKGDITSDVPTPAFKNGNFYVLSDVRNAISSVNAKTGKVNWTTEFPRPHRFKLRTSPTIADNKIYFMDHGGYVTIMDLNGKVLGKNAMGNDGDDQIRSSVAVAYNNLFIRTNSTLFCIGK